MRWFLALVTALAVGVAPCAAAPQPAADWSLVPKTVSLLRASIDALATRAGPHDQQYFANGIWHSADDTGLWDYQVGPGAAAAVLWRTTGERDQHLFELAVQTFDRAIADHRLPDGSFGPGPDPKPDTQSTDIATIWFGTELGTTYLELAPALGATRRAQWLRALTGGADWLIRHDLTWYVNGNDNLGQAELYYLAWRASGKANYQHAYNTELSFTLDPPQDRWKGFGLHLLDPAGASTRTPMRTVRLLGPAGYIAESGGGAPGFDPYYTQTQLDALTRLYVLSHDPRVLRVANLLVNAELPLVDSTWWLNTSDGTRHTLPNAHAPFITPALAVLGLLGLRPDLAQLAPSQFGLIDLHYRGVTGYAPPDYMGLSDEVAVILQAAAVADRQASRTTISQLAPLARPTQGA